MKTRATLRQAQWAARDGEGEALANATDGRSLHRLGNSFGCLAFHQKPRETCVLMTENSVSLGVPPRAGPPRKRIYKPRRGLNDISVLSKSCYGLSFTRDKAVIWRISAELASGPNACKPGEGRERHYAGQRGHITSGCADALTDTLSLGTNDSNIKPKAENVDSDQSLTIPLRPTPDAAASASDEIASIVVPQKSPLDEKAGGAGEAVGIVVTSAPTSTVTSIESIQALHDFRLALSELIKTERSESSNDTWIRTLVRVYTLGYNLSPSYDELVAKYVGLWSILAKPDAQRYSMQALLGLRLLLLLSRRTRTAYEIFT
jgi:hypothetical protein